MHSSRILIVDDEQDTRELLQEALKSAGYETLEAIDGVEALHMIKEESPDLVILDIMMPGMSGFQVLRQLRETSETPVIILSARKDTVDKIESFELGADDYITKPFELEELIMRIEVVLRRSLKEFVKSNKPSKLAFYISYGELLIDSIAHRVTLCEKEVILTDTEFRLLWELVSNVGKAVTYNELLMNVWGKEYKDETEYIHTYIRHIRNKIEIDPHNPQHIVTIPRVGYRFDTLD